MTPGRILPVSWYRFKILETHPCETLRFLEITHGRTPAAAISTILSRTWFGSGRPLMKTPPNWFTRPWPWKGYPLENIGRIPILPDITPSPTQYDSENSLKGSLWRSSTFKQIQFSNLTQLKRILITWFLLVLKKTGSNLSGFLYRIEVPWRQAVSMARHPMGVGMGASREVHTRGNTHLAPHFTVRIPQIFYLWIGRR